MNRKEGIKQLLQVFLSENIEVHGARELEKYEQPPLIANSGYGDMKARQPDLVGFDPEKRCIVFGIVRPDRRSLSSESSLTEYNVLLDHNADKGKQASMMYVLVPGSLLTEFTSIITHYIHREYWHRIVPVVSRDDGSVIGEGEG
jgi:hypothetical protein